MANVPLWLIGRGVTTCTVTLGTANATTGALTFGGTARVLVGLIDEVTYSASSTMEEIQAMTSAQGNDMFLEVAESITLSEILRAGANQCLLAATWHAADANGYIQVVLTRGGNTWTLSGVVQSYSESIRKGKSTGRLMVQMTDSGLNTYNPTYTT